MTHLRRLPKKMMKPGPNEIRFRIDAMPGLDSQHQKTFIAVLVRF